MNFLASDWSTGTESSRVHVSCSVLVLKSDEGNTEQAGGMYQGATQKKIKLKNDF